MTKSAARLNQRGRQLSSPEGDAKLRYRLVGTSCAKVLCRALERPTDWRRLPTWDAYAACRTVRFVSHRAAWLCGHDLRSVPSAVGFA